MATIIKRNNSWRVQVYKKGQRRSATFDTKKEAQEWACQIESALIDEKFNKPTYMKPQIDCSSVTVVDLFNKYKSNVSPNKRGGRWEEIRLSRFCKTHFFKIPLSDVTNKLIADWRDDRLLMVSPSTVNRELNLISAVFTMAIKEWGVDLPYNPVHMIKRPKNPKPRNKRVSEEEKKIIAKKLGWDMVSEPESANQWTAFAFFLAIETAMRRGEIASICWADVFLGQSYIHLNMTKNGEERDVPLSFQAKKLLLLLNRKSDQERLVPVAPNTITTLFRRAKLATGLLDLRFHDARREATTRFSKKLSNVLELSAVTGHKSLNMLQIYYKPKPADLAKKLDEDF